MVNRTGIWFVCVAICLLNSCSRRELDKQDYLTYYEHNSKDLQLTRTTDQLEFKVDYIPAEVLAYRDQEMTNNGEWGSFRKSYMNYDSALYFTLKISPVEGAGSFKDIIQTADNYSKIKQYLADPVREDFYIEVNNKKIKCMLMNVEEDVFMRNTIYFIISFEKPLTELQDLGDVTFVYNDKIFKNGVLKFHFSEDQLNNFPKVKSV